MNNFSEKILNMKLRDDNTSMGGIAFEGETVRDFITDIEGEGVEINTLAELNDALVACGIEPITNINEESVVSTSESVDDDEKGLKLFQVEVGVLLPSTHPEFEYYNDAFNPAYGYKNENIWFTNSYVDAVKGATSYVEEGVNNTYGIVSEIGELSEDFIIDNGNVVEKETGVDFSEDFNDFSLNKVVFSIMKTGEKTFKNFVTNDEIITIRENLDEDNMSLSEFLAEDIKDFQLTFKDLFIKYQKYLVELPIISKFNSNTTNKFNLFVEALNNYGESLGYKDEFKEEFLTDNILVELVVDGEAIEDMRDLEGNYCPRINLNTQVGSVVRGALVYLSDIGLIE